MPHKYFHILGIATYVHHRGVTTLPDVPPDFGRGQTLLCLHGSGETGAVFDGLMDRLAENHSPVAFDQPGHGRSGGLDSLGSVAKMAEFSQALCKELGLGPAVLLGHALGGAVALECALRSPESVRALVLCASGARLAVSDDELELQQRVSEGKARRPFQREMFGPAATPEVLRRGFLEDMKTDPRARLGDLRACRSWDRGGELAEIACPCLVVIGEHEQPARRAQAEALHQNIPGARKLEIPGAGHRLPLEAPDALAVAVENFLAELES